MTSQSDSSQSHSRRHTQTRLADHATLRRQLWADIGLLILLATVRFLIHQFTNHNYGFHRDELAMLENARHLAWGYVAYPPLTPFITRVAMEWFGTSLVALRFPSALVQAAAVVITGLMARELGGGRRAQIIAALAVVAAPISVLMGAMFQYVSYDYFWWVLTAYFLVRLLNSDNPRWWLAIGATIGLGMMTKYTMAFCVAGVVGGVLLTPARRYLRSPWLWAGAGLSLLIFLPNLIWQMQHHFISLEFLSGIHERDVRMGRTSGYLPEQLFVTASTLTLPIWISGLIYYFFRPAGRRYRLLGWFYVIPFVLFLVAQGRSYYLGPAYPVLFAGGAVLWERWLGGLPTGQRRWGWGGTWTALGLSAVSSFVLMMPLAPVNSPLWDVTNSLHDNFREQIGWPELVETVADIYHALPEAERAQTGILAGNYGEAGAINLYGPQHGLPEAISGVNSLWLRGYGSPAPTQVIILGYAREEIEAHFSDCSHAGRVTNAYGVENEEMVNPDIWLCREPRLPWSELWPQLQRFG